MTWWQGLFLGALQGFTEFLPISSSGHLALLQHLLNLHLSESELLVFDIFVHLGTLFALLYYYRRELIGFLKLPTRATKQDRNLLGYLIIGTLPAVAIGLTMKEYIEHDFGDMKSVGIQFFITGIILLSIHWIKRKPSFVSAPLTWWRALVMGIAQAVAILPAISRSGSTIVSGMWLGLSAEAATHFAFLLAIPAIAGAVVLGLADVSASAVLSLSAAWIGLVSSAVVGWLCLVGFIAAVRRGKLHFFAYYCFAIGAFTLWVAMR